MFNNALLMAAASAAASVPGRYVVNYSCRFNSADSAYMQRTFGAGNDEKFTVSFWWKKGIIDQDVTFLNAENSGSDRWRFDTATEKMQIYAPVSGNTTSLDTNPVFRDPSGWYHTVLVWDLSLLEGSRVQIYTNGMKTDLDVATAPVNTSTYPINTAIAHEIGAREGTSIFFDGYFSQYCFIDNAALTPADFGEFDENGVWRPIDITGLDYSGTNSFLLDFADSSDLGNDVSGNNNDWTVSGITSADQVTDTPTDNFPTLTNVTGVTYTEARTQVQSVATTAWRSIPATIRIPSTGKWCWEWTASSNGVIQFGAVGDTMPLNDTWGLATFGNISDNYVDYYVGYSESSKEIDGVKTTDTTVAVVSDGEKLQLLLDQDAGTAKYYAEGVLQVTHTGLNKMAFAAIMVYGNGYGTPHGRVDYGQDGFTKIDSDYAYLSTANFPEVTAPNSKKYFDAVLYQGNGLSQRIGQFQPIEEDYSVGNSALFIDDDSCFLSRTPSSVGDRRTMTFSFWFKKGNNGIQELLHSVTGVGNYMSFNTTNTFQLNTSGSGELRTTRTFSDSTQWYHFLVSIDTTQTTASDRLQIYVNGVQETDFGSETYPAQDTQMTWNTATGQFIGQSGSTTLFVDGYMAEAHFVDGQALAPSNFGEVDSTTNRWIPKEYTAGSVGSAVTVDFTANDSDSSDTTEYTFSSQSFGAADSDRKMVVGIVCYDDSPGTRVSAVTLGGVAANLVSGMIGAGATMTTEIWEADVPTGTTGDVVVTWAATVKSCGIGLWRLIGANSRPYGSGTTTADPGVLSTDIPAGGVAIGMSATGSGAGVTWSWTNLTEDFEDAITSGARSQWSGASAAFASAQTDLDITADASTAADNTFVCSVWGPTDTSYGINGYYLDFADKNDLGKDAAAGSGLIAGSEGTVIGDLTLHGGNAAAFDGQRTHTTAGAANTGDPRYIGKTWDSAKTVTGFGIWSYTNKGFVEGATPTVTIKLYGKTGSAPSSSSDGTVLFTGTVTDSGASGPPATVENFSFTPASYDHNWVEISSGGANCHVAQVEFYEGGTATSSGNDFTSSGFDTTNGSNQFYDTPTRNFAIMDPGRSITTTMTDGNLLATSGGATGQVRTPNAFGLTSGKWYFEFLMVGGSSNERTMYITQDDVDVTNTQIRSTTGHYSGYYSYDGDAMTPGDVTSATGIGSDYGDTYTAGDVISCALDLDIGAIWWGKNGTWQNSATEAEIEAGTVTNAAQVGLNSSPWYPTMQNNTTQASHANFGQHIYFDSTALTLDTSAGGYFRHAVPDGFKAINVDHLTESDSFQSGFVWIKNRSAASDYQMFDRTRGIYNRLECNTTAIESTEVDSLNRFLKQGASIGEDTSVNTANNSFVAWTWFFETTGSGTANEDGATNTTSTLVDTNSGVSISTYTGTGSATTFGHGLGSVPKFMMCKERHDATSDWICYHNKITSTPEDYLVKMNTTAAKLDDNTAWNDTAPTSTVFTVGTHAFTNDSGKTFVNYSFAEVPGFSHFGSYVGNGLTTGGPICITGFRPEWVIIKGIDSSRNWIHLTSKFMANPNKGDMYLASTNEQGTVHDALDFYGNGFKVINNVAFYDVNIDGENYIYMAFAGYPFGGSNISPGPAYSFSEETTLVV
jgi:hypothetical protein